MPIRLYNLAKARYALLSIERERLRVSRIEDLNDPFELLPASLADRAQRRRFRSFKTSFNDAYGVICFSRTWSNPVLWSHYGDRHAGICLGFDVDERCAFPVSYVASLQDVDLTAIERSHQSGLDFSDDEVKRLVATKFAHWEYENEMRVFATLHPADMDSGSYFFGFGPQLRLREVVVGATCDIPVRRICDAVRSLPDVTVRKARLAFTKFEVREDMRFRRRIARYTQWATSKS